MIVNKATTRWVLFCVSTKSLLAVGLTKMLLALICLPDAEKDSLINNSWKRAMSWTISVAGLLGFFSKKLPDIVKQFLGSSGFWRVYSNLIALEPYAFFALVIRNVLPRALFWCTPREPPTCLLLDFLKSVNFDNLVAPVHGMIYFWWPQMPLSICWSSVCVHFCMLCIFIPVNLYTT